QRLRRERRSGAQGGERDARAYFPFAAMGRARLEHFEHALGEVIRDGVPGDIADCGTGRGGAAIFARGFLAAQDVQTRQVWVADTFRAAPEGAPTRALVDGG